MVVYPQKFSIREFTRPYTPIKREGIPAMKNVWFILVRSKGFPQFIALFGPTLAAMCKQCAVPETHKASKATLSF